MMVDKTAFVELPDLFEQELVNDMFKELEHKKLNILILNPRHLANAQTIKAETQAVNDKFSQIKHDFNLIKLTTL